MNKILTGVLGLAVGLIGHSVHAQELPARQFLAGSVVLVSGDTIRGGLIYHPAEELVEIRRPDQATLVLTPQQVQGFAVRGEVNPPRPVRYVPARGSQLAALPTPDTARVRVFVVGAWPQAQVSARRSTAGFFELLAAGRLTLLQRESFQQGGLSLVPMQGDARRIIKPNDAVVSPADPLEGRQLHSTFYLLSTEGQLVELLHPREDISRLYPQLAGPLQAYVREHHLNWRTPQDLRQIVAYANSVSFAP